MNLTSNGRIPGVVSLALAIIGAAATLQPGSVAAQNDGFAHVDFSAGHCMTKNIERHVRD